MIQKYLKKAKTIFSVESNITFSTDPSLKSVFFHSKITYAFNLSETSSLTTPGIPLAI